jgi:hypothetical protein
VQRRSSRFAAILAAVVLAAVVTVVVVASGGPPGNGVASKSPEAILAAAQTAIDGLKSVRLAIFGSAPDGYYDFVAGKGTKGRIVLPGGSVEFVVIGNVTYMKGALVSSEVESMSHGGGYRGLSAAALRRKWLQDLPSGFASGLPRSARAFFSPFIADHGTLTKGAVTTVDGFKVVAITDKPPPPRPQWTVYVATTGKPYPIEITVRQPDPTRGIFEDFNAPIPLSAPTHPVNLAPLERFVASQSIGPCMRGGTC